MAKLKSTASRDLYLDMADGAFRVSKQRVESVRSPELSEEQQRLQDGAIEFARAELGNEIVRRDREEEFSREDWKKCAHFGVLGMPVAPEFGGMGLGITEVIAVMEGLGYGTSDQGLLFSINAHMWTSIMPISLYGTSEQKQHYLPRLSNGEWISAMQLPSRNP